MYINAEPPHFRRKGNGDSDVALIEWAQGRPVITPLQGARFRGQESVYLNGQELVRPLDLWPGSRIALLDAKAFFFASPDKAFHRDLPGLIERVAFKSHVSLLRRKYLLSYHMDQQRLRIMRFDQQLSRLEREADVVAKKCLSQETKVENAMKRVAVLKGQQEVVQQAIEAERFGRGDEKAINELKAELKTVRKQANEIELTANEVLKDAKHGRSEEAKALLEHVAVSAEKLEFETRLHECETWAEAILPHLNFTKYHANVEESGKKLPSKRSVLDEYFPGPDELGEVLDERPVIDAVLSDPANWRMLKWLTHLLAVKEFISDMPDVPAPSKPEAKPIEAKPEAKPIESAAAASGVSKSGLENKGFVARAVAARELIAARNLSAAEVTNEAQAARAKVLKAAADELLAPGDFPFAVKQRVVVYDAPSGAWLTARVFKSRANEVS